MKRTILAFALLISATACAVSTQQEVQMGQEYAQQVNAQLPIVTDPELNRYVNVLGDSIALLTSRGSLDWQFFIVDSKEVNAFALPGGFVYINRGLIERADKMDEVAGVLGHEIGHVVKRHTVKQMQQSQKANIAVTLGCILTSICNSGVGQEAINIAGGALFAKFSRTDEKEADDVGFDNVVRAGINPTGMVTMFQKLLDERKAKPGGVEAWFITHPLEEDRIVDIQSKVNRLTPAQLAALTSDSQNFHTFQRRLASLPPSPAPRQMPR